ncbi:MAG: energy transducer TonB [bacterium]|nr:energy transducer TonB [bacterium]
MAIQAQKEVLGIRVSRGGRVLKEFDLKEDFTVGGIRTDCNLIAWEKTDEKWVFVREKKGVGTLLFDDKVEGTISVGGHEQDIKSLLALGMLSRAEDKYALTIDKGQVCSVTYGGIQFHMEYRPAMKVAPVTVPKIKDETLSEGFMGLGTEEVNYYKSLAITVILGVAFFVLTQLVDPPNRELAMNDLIKRVTKLEVPEASFETEFGDEVTDEIGGGGGGGASSGGGGEGPAMPSTGVIAAITTLGSGSGKSIADILGAGSGIGGDLDTMADGIGGLSGAGTGVGGIGFGTGDGLGTGIGGDGSGIGGLGGGFGGGAGGGKTMHKKTVKVSGSVGSIGGKGAGDASRSRGAINAKIRAHLAGIQNLYNSELKKNPNMGGGKIVVRFTIGASGSVTAASIVSNGTGSSTLASGIITRVRNWRFPAASGDVTVVYPFVFVTTG